MPSLYDGRAVVTVDTTAGSYLPAEVDLTNAIGIPGDVTTALDGKAATSALGTAAASAVGDFATAAQGTLAGSALQSVAVADLPAGSVIYATTTTRPTARTDVSVMFLTVADPGTNALAGDTWVRQA